ncbi:sensor histidine kinase [Actinoplanes sp. NPDC049265]|uniref:sensor histidine kinase n=1 Tax=Actinoplanes sp. NPDC049265 TaxID=3363902 RepID=UPI003723A92A
MGTVRRRAWGSILVAGVSAEAGLIGLSAYWGLRLDLRGRPYVLSDVAVACCFAAGGLLAVALRPHRPASRILAALGLCVAVATPYGLVLPPSTPVVLVIKVVGEPAYWLQFALAGHFLLSYPSGQPDRPFTRRLVRAGYLVAGAGGGLTTAALVAAGRDSATYRWLSAALLVVWAALGVVLAGTVIMRRARSLPWRRRAARPVVGATVAATAVLAGGFLLLLLGSAGAAAVYAVVSWTAALALPIVLVSDVVRDKLAMAAIGEFVQQIGHSDTDELERSLGRVLQDPTLRLAMPTEHGPPTPREHDARRMSTHVGVPPIAVIEHDASLTRAEAAFRSAIAAVGLALDNTRLQARVEEQLRDIQDSRQRLARASDEERQRIERDLHDGAQQQLHAIMCRLATVRRETSDPGLRSTIDGLHTDLRSAVATLRSLAHGVRPPALTDQGLGPALRVLARRAAVPVEVHTAGSRRFAPVVEATAYYVVSEALQNVAKHAAAARAYVRVEPCGETLVVQVSDDGPGGASTTAGTGLLGLTDRVSAIGGRLTIESTPGAGTRLRAELPCEP